MEICELRLLSVTWRRRTPSGQLDSLVSQTAWVDPIVSSTCSYAYLRHGSKTYRPRALSVNQRRKIRMETQYWNDTYPHPCGMCRTSNLKGTKKLPECDKYGTCGHRYSHCYVGCVLIIGTDPNGIPSRPAGREDGSVVCTHDKTVACSIREVQALSRCLVDVVPGTEDISNPSRISIALLTRGRWWDRR